MAALWEAMESVWALSWLRRGCCVGRDGVCVDVIMVLQGCSGKGFYITEALSRRGRAEFAA